MTSDPHLDALSLIIGGACRDAGLHDRLVTALAPDGEAAASDGKYGRAVHRRLRRLADQLPPARELLGDPDRLALLSECVAVADPPLYMAVLSHYALCLSSLVSLTADPAELGERWRALETAQTKGVFLVTEVGDGSSHLGIRTTAEFMPDTGEFVLTTPDAGAAKFSGVGSSSLPQSAVVCARVLVEGVDRGVFSFLVDLSDEHGPLPGVEISHRVGLPSLPLDYALVRFRGVRLDHGHWLRDSASIDAQGGFRDPLGGPDARLQRTLCVGQALWATLPSAMAAMARRCAVQALRHSARRRAHGRLAPGEPVLAYRPQQLALLGCLADSFALTCAGGKARRLWADALAAADRDGPTTDRGDGMAFAPWTAVDRPLAVLKALSVRGAARVAAECQHRCGLPGFLTANQLQAYHGFAHAFDSAGGDSHLILLDTGRALATEDQDTSPTAPEPSGLPVSDPAWWPALARRQEHRLAAELRRAVREGTEAGRDGLELWNPLLDPARELGEAYADRLAAESVADTLATVRDPALRAVLEPLAAFYGAAQARRLAGRLLSSRVLSASQARALPGAMDGLCDRLLPHLPLLTEAMDTPRTAPPAPLGARDYAAALTDHLNRPPEGPS
ncbi:acyl-CoA dehydrogenase [Streptomyces sp. NPDC042319]|uniref:acyl-CoA dehydrogenase family protein n=1 Tax=Streptomyces sp. NPDC042319 TaxID=3154332 RepID=UPI0033D60941